MAYFLKLLSESCIYLSIIPVEIRNLQIKKRINHLEWKIEKSNQITYARDDLYLLKYSIYEIFYWIRRERSNRKPTSEI